MTWKTFHRRGEVLRAVIDTTARRRDGLLPMDVVGVRETFGDELTLLAALQLKWHTRLAGRIEHVLLEQPLDLSGAVAEAWGQTTDELPGLRLVLDHYRDHPLDDAMAAAMATATRKEHMMLAVTAGRSSVEDVSSAPIGAALEERARLTHRGATMVDPRPFPTFLERLRAVLAA